MSQEKVDAYKKEKANRNAAVEKARKAKKRNKLIARLVGCLFAVAIVVALGFTASNQIKAYKGAQPDYNADSMMVQDLCGVLDTAEDTETEADAEETEADAEETEADAEETEADAEETEAE